MYSGRWRIKVDFHIRVTPDTPEIRAAITAELRSFLLRDGYPQEN